MGFNTLLVWRIMMNTDIDQDIEEFDDEEDCEEQLSNYSGIWSV